MKKLIIIFTLLALASCEQNSKYQISTGDASYFTNAYTKNADGCLVFKNECGCGGDPQIITVCGTYSIVKNPGYETK
jgi:hypothetical protein